MVGVICFWDRVATPYLVKYEQILIESGESFEIIFWSRKKLNTELSYEDNYIYINQDCSGSKIEKIKAFFIWRRTIIKILNQKKYDQLIVLSTVPAVLLFFQLIYKYSGKYIFDIRDYTLEKLKLFRAIVMTLIEHSCITAISSKGYMRWLDNSKKILINHNITVDTEQIEVPCFDNKTKYNFAFVGNVRLDTQTKALLLQLKENTYINQYFYGRIVPGCEIEQLKEAYNIENLFLTGAFNLEDKKDIFKKVDIINCVYANADKEENIPLGDSTPLPNRLYDAITFYRPIVASKGTYLSELVEKYNLGCSINGFDPNAPDDILRYLNNFDVSVFIEGCRKLREIVIHEEQFFRLKCFEIIKQWNLTKV